MSEGKMRVIRIVNHIGMLLLMGVPIVLSGRDNLFEQFGHGTGQVWDSWSDVLFGWALWLAGILLWISLVRWVWGWLDRKLV
jgi:hypothetical protein